MYTVLLVDDEKSILESIQSSIPWEDFGISKVLLANNGKTALELLHSHSVHLLITDIKMPEMDGITLLKRVREFYPAIRCILLSAYGEFEYARAALTLGIENYLLKPLSVDELTASIQKSLENLNQSKQIDQNLFHDNILLRWITGAISEDELVERTPVLNVNIYSRNYCTLLIRRVNPNADIVAIGQAFESQLGSSYSVCSLSETPASRILILAGEEIDSETLSAQVRKIAAQADPIHSALITIGSVVFGSSELAKSYNDAQSTMQYASLFSTSQVISFGDTYQSAITTAAKTKAQGLLDLPTVEAAVTEGQALLADLFSGSVSTKDMYHLTSEVGTQILSKAQDHIPATSLTHLLEEVLPSRYGSLTDRMDKEGYFRWLENLVGETWLAYNSKTGGISPIVNQAIQYIRENYNKPISIKNFCSKFDMNASYLGYLFKNETGVFFNDYVSQIRIKQALNLLENTNEKISAIAENVGFSNVSYFIKCFRSHMGVSPVKYRQTKIAEAMADSEKENS